MRILVLSWEYPPNVIGGMGKHVTELTPALAQLGLDVHIVTPRLNGGKDCEVVSPGVTVHRVDAPTAAEASDIYTSAWQANRALEGALEKLWAEVGSFDLIHAHDWLTSFAAIALKLAQKCPLIATIHATERGRARGAILHNDLQKSIHSAEWRLTYEAWRLIACSRFMADEIGQYFEVPYEKIDIIPNGIDLVPFEEHNLQSTPAFRALYAQPDEDIIFSVGRIVHEKGLHILLNSAPQILEKHPSAKFVIAGTGPALDWLRHLAWETGIGDKVLFPGFISDEDRNRLFKLASCAVFPSLYEPFGIVALEAMAAGCPVVISKVGGLAEVVEDGKTGITITPEDPASTARGVLRAINPGDDTICRQVENAQNVVRDVYSWENTAAQTLEVYERVVGERAQVDW
ncbi:MAG: glycosyltransferase family 4 protein [Anaerolineae bacterium]